MKVFGIITNDKEGVFQHNVITGAQEIAARHGYTADVISLKEAAFESFDWRNAAGLLVISNVLSQDRLVEIYKADKPLSLVSHLLPNVAIPAVATNNFEGIEKLVRYLYHDCGRRNFVFICGDLNQKDGVEREQAFRREMMRYNLDMPPDAFLLGDFIPAVARAALTELVNVRSDFDAVIASDYLMGVEALDVLRSARLRVPEDISLVGFGDGQEAQAAGLTAVAADVVELGRRGARQLIGQIEGLRIRGLTLLSTELIIRETCKPQRELSPASVSK
jgi:LacI family transcriptional regulator